MDIGSFSPEHFVIGFILLAILNLLLEILGIGLLGGDRKPNFIIRLILILVLSGALGWTVCTQLEKNESLLSLGESLGISCLLCHEDPEAQSSAGFSAGDEEDSLGETRSGSDY